MRPFWISFVLLAATVSAAFAQEDPSAFQRALRAPMIDGVALAGLPLGATEGAAIGMLGQPASIVGSALADRALRYQLADAVVLDVHVGAGTIRAISVAIPEAEAAGLLSPTSRGVAIGMATSVVTERYGASQDFWYSAEGVAFNSDGPNDEVRSVTVFTRGMPRP